MIYEGMIQGKTVQLRSATEDDAEVTLKMRMDPEKSRFIHKVTGNIDDQRAFLEMQMAKDGDYLFIVETLDGEPIGMKGVYNHDPDARTVETGRFISYGSQIQSIEALLLSFDFAFEELGADKIRMSVLSDNTNMKGIQERFGVTVVNVEECPEFHCDSIDSILTQEAYAQTRPKILSLIERFANRA